MMSIAIGCTIMSIGFVFFINPYDIVPGGVYGMGIVLHNIFPHIQVGTFGYMFDIPLLTTAMILFGREFGGRTLFAALLTPGLMNLISSLAYPTREALQALDPSQLAGGIIDLSNDLMLASILGGTIIGIGLGFAVRSNATTGGTDIIAMILNRFAKIKFSNGVLMADSFVVMAGVVVIGFGVGVEDAAIDKGLQLSLYSLICIYVSSRVIDYAIDGASYDKLLFIVTNEHDKLRDFIINELDRSATYIKSRGMYTMAEREMIFLVVSRRQLSQVQRKIKNIDPKAFLVVTDAYDTYGEGFKPFPEKDTVVE
ncbi:MAG: YitT family protein [Rikenellaceae bacterium]|nr:YitT family protein [Rikenellaceae bacterium]MBQ3204909.1 YitT family protein [Alistipes sp.]MBR2014018.1 YitT family protein [Alistipes sp.]